jgi:hypothetical protein
MSLAVVNVGGSSTSNVGPANLLSDLSLTSAQSAQIEQVMAELQTGAITPVEARAQIDWIVGRSQTSQQAATPQAQPQNAASTQTGEPLTTYYELPLPQESLKGSTSAYNSHGVATDTVFSGSQTINAHA